MRDKPNTVASIGPIVKNGPPGPKMIAIPAEVAKNSRVQVVVFTEAELKIRDRRDNINKEISLPRKFVFSEGGETGHLTDVKQSWTRFCIRARLEDLHIHDLRRNLAS